MVTVYFRLFKQNYSLFSLVIFLQSSGVTVNSHNLVIISESCSTMTSGEGYLLKIQNLFPVEGTNIQNKRTKTCKRSILQLVASGSRQFSEGLWRKKSAPWGHWLIPSCLFLWPSASEESPENLSVCGFWFGCVLVSHVSFYHLQLENKQCCCIWEISIQESIHQSFTLVWVINNTC